ncbi:MAG TPA: alpha-L-fucosidase [Firmicutes bacterium]|nr:alpha-L-fucosidase [Bacillota bacterium]
MHKQTIEKRIQEFESMAFGLFVHWGLYSQLGKGEWIQRNGPVPAEEYRRLKDTFTADRFDALALARTAKRAGMKYITLTTRHHDGFSLYDTRGLNDYDAPHSPAGRDLVAEFVEGCRREGIVPFFYHTTIDWYEESFEKDFDRYLEYLRRSVEILCTHYGKIGGFWFDGNWSRPEADWKLDELYGTIRKYQPDAVIINNTGMDARGELAHPEIDSVTFEQGLPKPIDRSGQRKHVAAEMCYTMNDHWGASTADYNYKSPADLIRALCHCRKVGANLLLNIGPNADGSIPKMQEAVLEILGGWMDAYGTAVRDGRPADIVGADKDFGLRTPDGRVYLFVFDLPICGSEHVTVGSGNGRLAAFSGVFDKARAVRWLDNGQELPFMQDPANGMFAFHATGYDYGVNRVVRVAELIR